MNTQTVFMLLAFSFCMVSCIVSLSLLLADVRSSIRRIQDVIASILNKSHELENRVEKLEKGNEKDSQS